MKLYESFTKHLNESDYYNWKDDIIDVTDTDDLDLFYAVSENVVDKDEYGEYKDRDRDEAINEFMSNIINLFKIEKRSRLYKYLLDWYGSKEKMLDNVRDVYETSDAIYFVTGSGYSLFDNDLLGGNADGTTEKKFSEFVNNEGRLGELGKIEESTKLEEADSEVVWSSETTEDDYDEEFLKEQYKDYLDGFASEEDAKDFDDWKYDYVVDDSYDMWEIKKDDLESNIYPMIDKQINNDILIISGDYHSNYPDFRPSGSGGKLLNKAEDILDWLGKEDRIDFYVENGNLGVRGYDHDGSVGGGLYTLPDDPKLLLEIAKSTDYYNEDRTDEDILGEFSYDINHDYYDMSDFFKFSDKFVPIKWDL